jgi:hypothetical protein
MQWGGQEAPRLHRERLMQGPQYLLQWRMHTSARERVEEHAQAVRGGDYIHHMVERLRKKGSSYGHCRK